MNINDYIKTLSELEIPKIIKKVKVSPQFYNVIRSLFDRETLYGISSPLKTLQGIPVEIDDTLENDYELVY